MAKEIGARLTEVSGAVVHLGKHGHRDAQSVANGLRPAPLVDVIEHGARGIGRVGHVVCTAGQVPDQPGIDRTEDQLARLGARAGALHVVKQPGQLGAREIRVQQQPGAIGHDLFETFGFQCLADVRGAAILPDDGVVNRFSGSAIPDQRCFPLVGYADGRDFDPAGFLDGGATGSGGRRPEVRGVMFDPAAIWKVLRKLFVRSCDCRHRLVKHYGSRGCGTLIDGQNMGHDRHSSKRCLPAPYRHECQVKRIRVAEAPWGPDRRRRLTSRTQSARHS